MEEEWRGSGGGVEEEWRGSGGGVEGEWRGNGGGVEGKWRERDSSSLSSSTIASYSGHPEKRE